MVASTPAADPGSFRDSDNKVYEFDRRIVRGLSASAAAKFEKVSSQDFYKKLCSRGLLIDSVLLAPSDPVAKMVMAEGWSAVYEHKRIPFISYSYEWSFSMLKDAALAHLLIIQQAMESGWTLKDATSFNIQWDGTKPVFIDIGSFEPWSEGEPWIGYRQFCSMFLIPLMLKAHLHFDPSMLLRSQLEGIPPLQAAKLFRGLSRLKRGVPSHITLPSSVEMRIAKQERDNAPAQARTRKHSRLMVIGLLDGLIRLVRSLKAEAQHSDWSNYALAHSYEDADFDAKVTFVTEAVAREHRDMVWDIGCNTGTFSNIAATNSNCVVSMDGDADAVEQLYLSRRGDEFSKILPMVVNLANISPNQGWGGFERKALDNREKPSLILCLALIHHMRLSANVPIPMFLKWLRSLNADVVIEFVNRHDEMFEKLLTNKSITYPDYTIDAFEASVRSMFLISSRLTIKGGKRELFLLTPN